MRAGAMPPQLICHTRMPPPPLRQRELMLSLLLIMRATAAIAVTYATAALFISLRAPSYDAPLRDAPAARHAAHGDALLWRAARHVCRFGCFAALIRYAPCLIIAAAAVTPPRRYHADFRRGAFITFSALCYVCYVLLSARCASDAGARDAEAVRVARRQRRSAALLREERRALMLKECAL